MKTALIVIALGALAGAPQQSRDTVGSPQTRDTVGAPPTGTAVLSGQILEESSGRPLRRSTVTISGDNGVRRSTITDDEGRFAFKTLAAGHYTMNAVKAAYVQMYHGARRAGRGPGTSITVAAGQQVSNIQLKLPHGGAITGRIVDMNGRPQPNVSIQVSERRVVNGERRIVPLQGGGNAVTDDRGVYRAYGLPAGEYVVLATPRFGGPGDLRMTTAEELQWAQQQLQQKPAAMAGTALPAATPPPPAQPVAYAPVFYPGTTDIANAATVALSAGDERAGIDFSLVLVPTATVSGFVFGPDGRPAIAMVSLTNAGVGGGYSMSTRGTDGKGAFSLPNLSPGQYRIFARSDNRGGRGAGGEDYFVQMVGRGGGGAEAPVMIAPPPAPGAAPMWAVADVTVSGVDLTGIGLTLQPGATLNGRLSFKGAGAPPPDLSKVRVVMTPATQESFGLPTVNVTANADGSFKLEGLGPGKFRLTSNGAGGAWFLKSAIVGGVDILDGSLEVKLGQEFPEMTLVFDDRPTELSGKLLDAKGAPAAGYSMIAFSTDKTTWTMQTARRTKSARPSADGKFVIAGLPAGDYFLAAVTDFDQTDLSDAAFLEEIAAGAMKITIAEGEKKVQDLRLARIP